MPRLGDEAVLMPWQEVGTCFLGNVLTDNSEAQVTLAHAFISPRYVPSPLAVAEARSMLGPGAGGACSDPCGAQRHARPCRVTAKL